MIYKIMETSWISINLCVGLSLLELCDGLPINLEDTVHDSHTQLLTGLIAVLLTICSIVFLAGCLCCQRGNGFKEFRNSPVVASSVTDLDHGHINPVANAEFTIFTPLSPPHHNNNVFLANQQVVCRTDEDYGCGDIDVSAWFDDKEKDFPRIKLKYIRELGKGWFGRVVEGAAQDLSDEQSWTPVAVRILEATATSKDRVLFLHDAEIYRIGTHPNILKLLGRSLDTVPFLILQEYCPQGDLKNYLCENKPTAEKLLSSESPLLWCCQITSALKFLHEHKVTHPDLATRNCQLSTELNVKLGDYGTSVNKYPQDYYQATPGVSVRWCAPESLIYTCTTIQSKKVTKESNIWSLGVTMWEIYECGTQPYSWLSDDEVITQVLGSSKIRLPRPTYPILYIDYIYRLMQMCWTTAESRPAIVQIDLMLSDLMQVYKNTKKTTISIEDFDQRWETFKPNSIVKTDNQVVATNECSDSDKLLQNKTLSPSLNNLHGSLDNLLDNESNKLDSWLENVATKTGDLSFVQGLSEAMNDLDNTLALENASSSGSSHPSPIPQSFGKTTKIEFKLGPMNKILESTNVNQNDSLFVHKTSSESETEDENWKKKIERGAYSEKVRQKSRSVTDLMILTHIDCSESDSETPQASLDNRNYRNVRCTPKQNLENVSLMFGSEGNLLNVQNTFQEELKKLQEERRDSLLFVPEKVSHNLFEVESEACTSNANQNTSSPVSFPTKLLEELNSPTEIKPTNQVYNVFNVTVDSKFSPIHCKTDLSDYINLNESESLDKKYLNNSNGYQVPKLSYLIEHNVKLANFIEREIDKTLESPPNKSLRPDELNKTDQFDQNLLIVENGQIDQHKGIKNGIDTKDSTNTSLLNKKGSLQFGEVNVEDSSGQNLLAAKNVKKSSCESDTDVQIDQSEEVKEEEILQPIDFNLQDSSDQNLLHRKESVSETDKNVQINQHEEDKNKIDVKESTITFLRCEKENYESEKLEKSKKIEFDLSQNQEEIMPNSLTHSNLFANSAFNASSYYCENEEEMLQFSSNFALESDKKSIESANNAINYSLETWDSFLGKTLDDQNEPTGDVLFDQFSNEPHSLLFIDNGALIENVNEKSIEENEEKLVEEKAELCAKNLDETRPEQTVTDPESVNNIETSQIEEVNLEDINVEVMNDEKNVDAVNEGSWESGGGWFLHPQSNNENISGEIDTESCNSSDTYLGFNVDDEIMAAIRKELITKLPYAQGASSSKVQENDEWESSDKNEVFLRYNVYNTPLSPIPEEVLSGQHTPRSECSDEVKDVWSEQEEYNFPLDVASTETHSAHTLESLVKGVHLRHTPSQDSCCSNDTLFNLEELTCVVNENDKPEPKNLESLKQSIDNELFVDNLEDNYLSLLFDDEDTVKIEITEDLKEHMVESDKSNNINDVISETETISNGNVPEIEIFTENSTNEIKDESLTLNFSTKQVAPLPSPEDVPWKQLPASMLSYDQIISRNDIFCTKVEPDYSNVKDVNTNLSQPDYVNEADELYANVKNTLNETDYVNLENVKNSAEYVNTTKHIINDCDEQEFLNENQNHDLYGVLTDIRFSGPCDSQLMSTSFSESNDLGDEQDWDSGSDTRSSSSGEFIWKNTEEVHPMKDIQEEDESSDCCTSDEEGECPEFIPSAWDKYATPTKSALRSPEKALDGPSAVEKKPKGVWFKKQKYHCVYEYPKEPESPIMPKYDLWQPTDYDWELDDVSFIPSALNNFKPTRDLFRPKTNIYQLTNVSDFGLGGNCDDFFVSSSTKPFNLSGSSSQFFPGQNDAWAQLIKEAQENITPDSGVEDMTPASTSDYSDFQQNKTIPTLKSLATIAVNKNQINDIKNSDVLGGLRHTRSTLKLDLPPNPHMFNSNAKIFPSEAHIDPVINRTIPTFTTFGKSRFTVQHIDTPPDEDDSKNVSIEVLPCKPMFDNKDKNMVEVVRGEASLLDSADEDSGIDSSTLERKTESNSL